MSHSPERIFEAFARPELLARWWGPAGFTNTFEVCDFKPGGTWKYVMHGPKGANFKNESIFEELSPRAVVIRHVSKPTYRLTIGLTPNDGGTIVTWTQAFDEPAVAQRIEHIVLPANEENLDRLQTVLGEGS